MRFHMDERASRYCDVFKGLGGDCNVFHLRPAKPSGWHRHQYQEDQFFVAAGDLIVGKWRHGEKPQYTELTVGDSITIPPTYWHGYESKSGAIVVMYLSHKYEDGWDEEPLPFEAQPWSPLLKWRKK